MGIIPWGDSTVTLNLSYSGATTWRECQQRYWYNYEDKIKPKIKSAPAPKLGNWLHSYLERYYQAVKRGIDSLEGHEYALDFTIKQYEPELKAMVALSLGLGQEELAKEFDDISARGIDIAKRYYIARGMKDAEQYEVLFVELRLNTQADEDIRAPGIADLVVRDLDRGVLQMWDHKSTGTVPGAGTHILDMQEVLYAAMLHENKNIQVDELVWNYLRTKSPTVPNVLQKGGLSKAQNIDTDAPTYMQAIVDNNLLPDDYTEVFSRLAGKEQSVFYPRHRIPLLPDSETIIIGDFVRTGHEILRAKSDDNFIPIKNLGRNCNWCAYNKICTAVVTGGDVDDIIRRNFEERA